jgi:hypothetical protein
MLLFSIGVFLFTVILFEITSARRRRLDRALLGSKGGKQLGLFTAWPSPSPLALAEPERRWTYDQDYMVAFIDTLYRDDPEWLAYYAGPILRPDILFAIAFAACIVATALLGAQLYPWTARPALFAAAMGVVYGSADIAEDLKLQRILRRASQVLSRGRREDVALADAAEVDATNALTRLKIASIVLSGIGLCIFVFLRALDSAIAGIVRQRD